MKKEPKGKRESSKDMLLLKIFSLKVCVIERKDLPLHPQNKKEIFCGNSSVGRAQPCQGWGREFEPRFPLNR